MGWQQNFYKVKHPEKYIGDIEKVFYRSSWELDAFEFCDNNIKIIRWASEEIAIPYVKPTNNGGMRPAKYYPDLYIEYTRADGKLCRDLIEIKPSKQTKVSKSRNPKNKLFENHTYMVNQLKWEAAKEWCSTRGVTFWLVTEKELFK